MSTWKKWNKRQLCQERQLKVSYQFSSVQLLSRVQLFATPWTAAHQASLLLISCEMSKLWELVMELVMPSNHLIFCPPLLLLPSVFPSIRVFSNESVLPIRWPKYWSFSFNISPSNEHSGLIFFRNLEVHGSCTVEAWLVLSITLLVCEMSAIMRQFEHSLALPFFGIGMETGPFPVL